MEGTAATDDTPPRGGGITLVQVGDMAKRAGNEAFACRTELAALRAEVQLVIRPIRRTWSERASVVVAAIALAIIAYATVVGPRAEAKPVPAASSR